jgi:hypothetical protein
MENKKYKCCICGTEQEGIGYDPSDYYREQKTSKCCRKCRRKYVLPILKMEKEYYETYR